LQSIAPAEVKETAIKHKILTPLTLADLGGFVRPHKIIHRIQ
jgi:hypothetical protein